MIERYADLLAPGRHGPRWSTVTPSTSRRCRARLRMMSSAPSGRVNLPKASSSASGGRRRVEPCERIAQPLRQDDLPVVTGSAVGSPGAISAPLRACHLALSSHASAACSTTLSVKAGSRRLPQPSQGDRE